MFSQTHLVTPIEMDKVFSSSFSSSSAAKQGDQIVASFRPMVNCLLWEVF
jgi:hypothetical protein